MGAVQKPQAVTETVTQQNCNGIIAMYSTLERVQKRTMDNEAGVYLKLAASVVYDALALNSESASYQKHARCVVRGAELFLSKFTVHEIIHM